MREYETIFVVRPDGTETQTKQLLDKVNGIIERRGGTILQQKNWGKRDLAYQIKKYKQGVYFYYNYAGDSSVVSELEKNLSLLDLSLRFLTVKLSDVVDVEARKKELAEKKEDVQVPDMNPPTRESVRSNINNDDSFGEEVIDG